MKKFLAICFLFLNLFSVKAQSWCALGAEWAYNYQCQCPPKIIKIIYTGTVIVNGNTCQQLNRQSIYTDFFGTQTFTSSSVPTYTTQEFNNVVFLRAGNTNNFDTLYNFNAIPGSKWLLPDEVPASGCNRRIVTVLDTGHRVISSINLRWLKVTIFDNTGLVADTIFERIGLKKFFYLQHFICPIPLASDPPFVADLRCYNDNQINYKLVSGACDYIAVSPNAVKENEIDDDYISFFPNPVSNNLSVIFKENKLKSYKIVITNCFGEIVYQFNDATPIQNIDMGFLKSGIYYLKVYDENTHKIYKIVKE